MSAYSAAVLALSPSAYWRLGGNGTDATANGRNMTNTGSYVTGAVVGDSDQAFRGTGSIASASWMTGVGLTGLSFVAWVKTGGPNVAGIFGRSDIAGINDQWNLYYNAGKLNATLYKSDGTAYGTLSTTATTYADSAWHMVACSWNGSTWILNVDGVQVATMAAASGVFTSTVLPITVGSLNGNIPMTNNTVGAVDEAAVWYGTALTNSDFANLYALATTAPPVALNKATENDTAQVLTPVKGTVTVSVGRASETETGQTVTPMATITVAAGQATDTETAAELTPGGAVVIGQTSESDTAQPLTAVATITVGLGTANETDTGQVLTTQSTIITALGRADETDTASAATPVAGTVVAALGLATETDTSAAFAQSVVVTLGLADETDTATLATVSTAITKALGRATETDSILAILKIGGGESVIINQATETETAGVLTYVAPSGVTITVRQASETSTAQWITVPTPAGDLTLLIIDDELADTPANILVNVGNGNDGETISFSITGPAGFFALLTTELDDEDGTIQISVPLPELTAGTYVLRAVGTASGEATDQFLVLEEPLVEAPDPDDNTTPDVPTFTPDPAQHWQLIDPTTGDEHSYTFPHNPSKWTNPNRPNFLEHDVTTAPDGNILAWEGAERSWTFEFSGYLDTQAQYEALVFWANLRRRFWLIDHRNKAHYVTFEQPDMRARIVPNKPWAHDYTIRALHFYRDGTA